MIRADSAIDGVGIDLVCSFVTQRCTVDAQEGGFWQLAHLKCRGQVRLHQYRNGIRDGAERLDALQRLQLLDDTLPVIISNTFEGFGMLKRAVDRSGANIEGG